MAQIQSGGFPLRGKFGDKIFYKRNGRYFFRVNAWYNKIRLAEETTLSSTRRDENNNEFRGAWVATWNNLWRTAFMNQSSLRGNYKPYIANEIFKYYLYPARDYDRVHERGFRSFLFSDPDFISQSMEMRQQLNPIFYAIRGLLLTKTSFANVVQLPHFREGYNWVDANESSTYLVWDAYEIPAWKDLKRPKGATAMKMNLVCWWAGNTVWNFEFGLYENKPVQMPLDARVGEDSYQLTLPQVLPLAEMDASYRTPYGVPSGELQLNNTQFTHSDGIWVVAVQICWYQDVNGVQYDLEGGKSMRIVSLLPVCPIGTDPTP